MVPRADKVNMVNVPRYPPGIPEISIRFLLAGAVPLLYMLGEKYSPFNCSWWIIALEQRLDELKVSSCKGDSEGLRIDVNFLTSD